jgi:hypothetical protein
LELVSAKAVAGMSELSFRASWYKCDKKQEFSHRLD